ncbi:MAG: papain-like cysteine protease family protein [Bacteroidia bacterium]
MKNKFLLLISCFAITGKLFSQTVSIHYDVELVAQPDSCTCWAASSSMILSYHEDAKTTSYNPAPTVKQIIDKVNNTSGFKYDISCGLSPEDTKPVSEILGLSFEQPQCYGVEGFVQILKRKGPVVFMRAALGNKGAHAIAVNGMHGDGTPEGTTVETLNPSPVGIGAAQNVKFSDLMKKMEQLGFWDGTDWAKSGGKDRVYIIYRK